MDVMRRVLNSQRFSLYSGALLAMLFGTFAFVHLREFIETGKWSLLLVVISELLTTLFFVFRSNPKTVSMIPYDWMVAVIGSFAPLFFRPAADGVLPEAGIIIALGTILQIAGLLSLNRSFAIVAAKREIKTEWMYRVVRHPLYAAYFLIFGGYVLVHTTTANLLIYIITMTFLCLRIFREEKHLLQDPTYCKYILNVRYRVIPYIF